MIKKIFLIFVMSVIITSCGKKGDPVYEDKEKTSKIFSTQQSKVL